MSLNPGDIWETDDMEAARFISKGIAKPARKRKQTAVPKYEAPEDEVRTDDAPCH